MPLSKLPNVRVQQVRRRDRNEWIAADQLEKQKMIATIAAVSIVLGLGIWLVVFGIVVDR